MTTIPRRTIHLYDGELADLLAAAVESPAERRAQVAAFEDHFTRLAEGGIAVPVGAGRLGLRLILKGLGIGAGSEVIVPAFTDESVPEAVRAVGASPRFVDVDPQSMNLTPDGVRAAIGPRTRAVLATHLFGNPCDIEAIVAIAESAGIHVIEDCAHAIDARVGGVRCGGFGRAAIFSFVVTKAVNTFGGGMVLTRDTALADYVRGAVAPLPEPDPAALLRRIAAGYLLHVATSRRVFGTIGGPMLRVLELLGTDVVKTYDRVARPATINANVDTAFSPLQAAVGLPQLRALEATQARRRDVVSRLLEAMPESLRPQTVAPNALHAYYFLVVTADDPGAMAGRLLARGVDVGRRPMRCVADAPSDFPNATYLQEHTLQLPIHPELSEFQVTRMARALKAQSPT